MTRILSIDERSSRNEAIELSDDRPSCELFWGMLLDFASLARAQEVNYKLSDGDNCISMTVDGTTYPIEPLPVDVRRMYLRFAQDLILGRLWYTILILLGSKPFFREHCEPLLVEAGSRRSKWETECTRESIRFRRL